MKKDGLKNYPFLYGKASGMLEATHEEIKSILKLGPTKQERAKYELEGGKTGTLISMMYNYLQRLEAVVSLRISELRKEEKQNDIAGP